MQEETAPGGESAPESAQHRIEALERELAKAQAELSDMRSTYQSLHDMLMHARTPICMWQGDDFVYTLVNENYCAALPERQFLGKPLAEALPEAVEQGFMNLLGAVYRTGQPFIGNELPVKLYSAERGCEEQRWYNAVYAPVRDAAGNIVGVCHYGVDITAQVEARQAAEARAEELRKSAELIAAQQETIRVLGTPLLPLAKDVLAMPLIGPIDSRRSAQILEGLLRGVEKAGASTVILDVTGVDTIDTQAANALVAAARALRLLGARVLLTGLQPSMAQVLVELGVDLGGIATYGTLQSGIAAAMSERRPPPGGPPRDARAR
ncbi:STAS domain-containing protein [Sorangium sp. So ce315]|uniref:STAS domain-containing protein n=1 Tax=Sorangium sp. So ce315 TaxID=3133299 RepID=UPI003F61F7B1